MNMRCQQNIIARHAEQQDAISSSNIGCDIRIPECIIGQSRDKKIPTLQLKRTLLQNSGTMREDTNRKKTLMCKYHRLYVSSGCEWHWDEKQIGLPMLKVTLFELL